MVATHPMLHRTSRFWNLVRWTMLVAGIILGILALIAGHPFVAIAVAALSFVAFRILAGTNSCVEYAAAFILFGIGVWMAWSPMLVGYDRVSTWAYAITRPAAEAPATKKAEEAPAAACVQPAWPTDDPNHTLYVWNQAGCAYLPVTTTTTTTTTTGGGTTDQVGKCDWLRKNFPQTVSGIQALGTKLTGTTDPKRIRTHVYDQCGDGTVYDGFIVLGPSEGHSSEFSIQVPDNGAVDTYGKASCSGTKIELGKQTDTYRCLSGTVKAVNATYWPWLDENPPVSGGASSASPETSNNASASGDCIDPVALAKANSWSPTKLNDGKPNEFGGLQVKLNSAGTLPNGWEADGPNQAHIADSDTSRSMSTGVWTFYPPFACRDSLGYSK